MARDRTRRARAVVQAHLRPGEHLRAVCVGSLRDPVRGVALVSRLERFFGVLLGSIGVLVLTNDRMLLLPLRARDKSGDRWFQAQYAARSLLATGLRERSSLVELTVRTGLGDRRLLFRRREAAGAAAMAAALGWQQPAGASAS
jgi:hypothetical protein